MSWLIPAPVPIVHDEFSYLLAGDTFAHGRLTNPPHPMWVYFDTFHELQRPTYMSKYFPAQGAFLALGQILGHSWIGILLSMAGMCAAVLWALQGWLPPRWALLGGILVLFRFAIFSYWINSYWGGAVAALGGALVIGALPRIVRFRRPADAATMAIGLCILANSRPFEGFIFSLPVAVALILSLSRKRDGPPKRNAWRWVVLPFCAPVLVCVVFDAYYNYCGTGNPSVFPYVLYERTHSSVPTFQWQEAIVPPHYQNPQFETFYGNDGYAQVLWKKGRVRTLKGAFVLVASDLAELVLLFLYPALCVPILVSFPRICRDSQMRLLVIQTLFCFVGFFLVVWFQPHYAAPLTATIFALVVQGIRQLRVWRIGSRPVGIGLTRVLILLAIALPPFLKLFVNLVPRNAARAHILQQLNVMSGDHLVIVRYSPKHDPQVEWVYNRADIDHAKVIWAREIPGVPLDPLLVYFHDRKVWLVEPDANPPRLSSFSSQAAYK